VRNEEAGKLLETARKFIARKMYVPALANLEKIEKQYADTEAGKAGAALLAELRADKMLMKKIEAERLARRARSAFLSARGYERNGLREKAVAAYQAVIRKFPGTPEAAQAAAALKRLGVAPEEGAASAGEKEGEEASSPPAGEAGEEGEGEKAHAEEAANDRNKEGEQPPADEAGEKEETRSRDGADKDRTGEVPAGQGDRADAPEGRETPTGGGENDTKE